jgi:hypothetical protein
MLINFYFYCLLIDEIHELLNGFKTNDDDLKE